ncbi:DAHP synthetase, class II [Corchorus olitorius]|uniref:Phospho-2-dehydro-3-deoxyheptonate aldolase n=1 Tax=Corchorus olitorius TaxID=93759 RepID=A0A1R3J3W0_9ROSI|nr:DAHP synthetase, class II [Corchorus olitorius]
MALTSPFLLSSKYPQLLRPHHPNGQLLFPSTRLKPIKANSQSSIPTKWSPESWKTKKAFQLPEYPDQNDVDSVLQTLSTFPALVFAGEARSLEKKLGDAARGNGFLLQGGDCAESFQEFNAPNIRDTFRVILQMGVVLMFGAQMPIIKVGRMAGQFAKPRSDAMEEKDGVKLPSYRGDTINGDAFDEKCRVPNLHRMIKAYLELADRVDEAMGFMGAAGITNAHPVMAKAEFWTSHECLLLPYEQALTRKDSTTGLYYDCSAHMLWVGERTRHLDGAHVEFLRGVANPLGIKVSEKMDPEELVRLIEILNPQNKPGRITVIVRMGAKNLRVKFPNLIRAVRGAEQIVTWVNDRMHGNTSKASSGLKTRSFDAIKEELSAFFEVHEQEGSYPGGVHLEMTGQDVTECVGGSKVVTYADLGKRYRTHCDPRLNASQSLELAFIIADRLRKTRLHFNT